MASVRDSFSDLAYLFNSNFAELDSIEEVPEIVADQQKDVDVRESLAESAIIPRESFFGPPPPVPSKDTRPNTQIYELSAEPTEASIRVSINVPVDKTHEEPQKSCKIQPSALATQQTSSRSDEVQIRLPSPTFNPQNSPKKPSIRYKLHPLMLSPPSPVPAQALQMLEIPQRPARSDSLRLPSSLARKRDLTTSVVLVLGPERPETAKSYQTQPHTRYNASSRIKYARGKHATTELVPQPSDDPRDPLVSVESTISQHCH